MSQLGPDHPDTLTSQNNLASAYQDAGRVAEAIQLYELNLAERERLLGVDHPGTLTSRGNLAAAYLAAGRAAEAIPLLEQTLASRERVLGPDHPDTRTSRRNLAKAYQDAGRADEAIPLLEQTPAGRPRVLRPDHPRIRASRSQAPADAAAKAHPAGVRRPPAGPARPVLPAGVRRPPADPARPARPDRAAAPHARLPGRSSPGRTPGVPRTDAEHDREVLAAIAAGDPAGIAMAYDRYAAGLYGYCHWMLHDAAGAAESVQDTFVLAAATLGGLPEPVKLRPWLFALARNDCRRRILPRSATSDEAGEANHQAGRDQRADEAQPADEAGQPADAIGDLADATVQFRAVSEPAISIGGPADPTVQFSAVSEPAGALRDLGDATVQFSVVGQLADATMQFRVISETADAADGIADFNGYLGQAELRELIRSILADMKPREREVVELSFRHDLFDNDLAIALGMSVNRAHALAARTRGRLEKSLAALRTALAGRQACPVMGELLADWDGQLTEQTRDLVAWHIEQCQICVNQNRGRAAPDGSFRPAAAAPAPSGTAGEGPEPLLLHRRGRGSLPPAGGPARGIDLGGTIRAGDQAGELGQHPGPSRTGGRHRGCRAVGRGGRDRHAAHLRRPPRRTCPDGPACRLPRHPSPGRPDQRRDLGESYGRPDHGGRSHIRRCEAVPGPYSAPGVRAVPVPAAALARGVEIALAQAFEVTLAFEVALALALAVEVALALALVIPVADGLRPAADRHQLAN